MGGGQATAVTAFSCALLRAGRIIGSRTGYLDDDWVHAMRGQLASWDVHPQRMESVISTALAGYRGALLLALTTADWTAADEAITSTIEALTQQISQEEREPS